MNSVLECIYSRSSVRNYTDEDVSEKDVKEITKAGFHAPTGLNRMSVRYFIVQNREKIDQYSELSKDLYKRHMDLTGECDPILEKIIRDENSNIFYKAPVVIFVFASDDAATPMEDGCLAIGNMMIAAESLGYGTCFIGLATGLGYYSTFKEENNVPDKYQYVGCITLGKAASRENHPRGATPIENWIR